MIEVVDASVAVKWFVRDDEPELGTADGVLDAVVREPHRFTAPSLLGYELVATLARRLRDASLVASCVEQFLALGVALVEVDARLLQAAVELGFAYRLTGYDAAYLAVAQQAGGTWITFDREASRRAARSGLVRLLREC